MNAKGGDDEVDNEEENEDVEDEERGDVEVGRKSGERRVARVERGVMKTRG
jgi:hypothetical protein